MGGNSLVLLYVGDHPVLSSLEFSLAIDGFEVADGAAGEMVPSAAAALVIDQGYLADGLAALVAFREAGCGTPAILLATNPNRRLRAGAAGAGAVLIEKPLLGDELTGILRAILKTRKAA